MNFITERVKLENEIGSLKIQNDFMRSQIIDLVLEKTDLRKRLSHLLESDFINSFDAKDFKTGKYKRDIKEADEITKPRLTATNLYDKETIIENATVQIWENTVTGETSIGWWKNE